MSQRHSLTCRDLVEFLLDYTDGTLPPDRRAEFDRHLRDCGCCTNYLASYRLTIELGRAALDEPGLDKPLDARAPQKLIDAILAATRPRG